MGERPTVDEAKRGSAELLILALVEDDSLHGYEIARQIELRSGGDLTFTLAALYATLYRMEARRWISGRWVERAGSDAAGTTASPKPAARCWPRSARTGRGLIAVLGQVAGVRYA